MIERNFDVPFVADLALREKQIQQNYRPIIAIHKWFARRPGTLFRGILLSEFAQRPLREAYYCANSFPAISYAWQCGTSVMGGSRAVLRAPDREESWSGFRGLAELSWCARTLARPSPRHPKGRIGKCTRRLERNPMKYPFEASFSEIQNDPEPFVTAVFSSLESEFLDMRKVTGSSITQCSKLGTRV